jgi:hypothetical protein
MDRLFRRNGEGVERIRAIILFDDVRDDYGIYDRAESDENYVEPGEGDSEGAEDATLDDYCCSELDTTDKLFLSEQTRGGGIR